MRLAAVADLHCRVDSAGRLRALLQGIDEDADVLILAGDLTDNGLPSEMNVLLGELDPIGLPTVAVLGNHDHEGGQAEQLTRQMCDAGVHVLDATATEIDDVGFAGTKGFCGGFDEVTIQPFGEAALKAFIQTSIDEALRLENALTKLECPNKVAVLHYAPVKATLEGERLELYPFLGSSRLENALDRHRVDVIFHGHAHHGSPNGHTRGGIPVHNVSRFVRDRAGKRPFGVFEVSARVLY